MNPTLQEVRWDFCLDKINKISQIHISKNGFMGVLLGNINFIYDFVEDVHDEEIVILFKIVFKPKLPFGIFLSFKLQNIVLMDFNIYN